jgi:hypothetical protein
MLGAALIVFGYCWVTLGIAIFAYAAARIEDGASEPSAYRFGMVLAVFIVPGVYCYFLGHLKKARRTHASDQRWPWDDAQ